MCSDVRFLLRLRVPVRPILDEALGGEMTEEAQLRLERGLQDPQWTAHEQGPYAMQLLNAVLERAMRQGRGLSDELAAELVKWTRDLEQRAEPGWRGSPVATMLRRTVTWQPSDSPSEKTLTVRVSTDMLAGNTGCHLWPAGLALAQVVEENRACFQNRVCLSLGCGVGLDGMVCLGVGARAVVFADASSEALANTELGLSLNGVNFTRVADAAEWVPQEGAAVWKVRFEDVDVELPEGAQLLAADVLYGPELADAVADMLERLARRNAAMRGITCWLAAAVRDPDMFGRFAARVESSPVLQSRTLNDDASHDLFPGTDALFSGFTESPIKVLAITFKDQQGSDAS